MRSITTIFILFLLIVFSVPSLSVYAEESYEFNTVLTTTSFRFNNENWFTTDHPKIASFSVHDDGSAYGNTETGVSFFQYNIPNDYGIRIQRFEIQDHYHYIIDGEIAYTTTELSMHLAKAQDAV